MTLDFISVGYGEAILIRTETQTILVDAGSAMPEEYTEPSCMAAAGYLKAQGIGSIDMLVITHLHEDHVGGAAEVLRHFPVSEIRINLLPRGDASKPLRMLGARKNLRENQRLFLHALAAYGELRDAAEARHIPIRRMACFDEETLKDKTSLVWLGMDADARQEAERKYEALFAAEEETQAETLLNALDAGGNATSLALHISQADFSALLCGDQISLWETLGGELSSTVLKPPHHGQRDGLPEALLQLAKPEAFVVCTSADQRHNSAAPELLARAKEHHMSRGRPNDTYVTGLLAKRFGKCGGRPPVALRISDFGTQAIWV